MLLIIPHDHPIKMKVSLFKKFKKVIDVTSATMVKLNNLRENDRLLIKFSPTKSEECHQRSMQIYF